jgi:hypothetical protein
VDDKNRELKERISRLSDDELIEMVTVSADDYVQEALDHALAELKRRGVELSGAAEEDSEPDPETAPDTDPAPAVSATRTPGTACAFCGGRLRKGSLVADKELTIIFADTREERFVSARACRDCGQVALVVDFDTEVES